MKYSMPTQRPLQIVTSSIRGPVVVGEWRDSQKLYGRTAMVLSSPHDKSEMTLYIPQNSCIHTHCDLYTMHTMYTYVSICCYKLRINWQLVAATKTTGQEQSNFFLRCRVQQSTHACTHTHLTTHQTT